MDLCSNNWSWRVGTHATSVRPGIAFTYALVILTGSHGKNILSIDNNNKAGFLAGKKLFNYHATSCISKGVARKHVAHGFFGLFVGFSNNHAFACCETVRLHNNGGTIFLNVGQSRFHFGECLIEASGNIMASQKILSESF